MFEITPEDIEALNDADLRDLVGHLSEAILRSHGLPTSAVTFGGNQDAKDGGIDVRVALPRKTKIAGFIPKPVTVFQVKKPDLIPSKIEKEMRPGGKIRPVIRRLAAQAGAYIIVCSSASLSETAYSLRLKAMSGALKGVPHASALTLDFYDRKRLATWLRDYPALIPWVRSRAGHAIQGWQSYGPWVYPAEGMQAAYLLDDKIRIRTDRSEDSAGLSAIAGIEQIRDSLRNPRKVVRIVGVSGVGKTRLVQALFDDRVGMNSLNPTQVVYTNLSDDPNPQPVGLASDFIAAQTRVVMVIDNCPPDLHRRLTETCRQARSTVSVVTVEYDIRDDEPEETDVFRIEPSSPELIEKLVRQRFKQVSAIDAQTIAKFSGGNARIAIALASTVGKNDKLTGLSDEDLFKRLFQQRHGHDADLLLIAQACSLVYSFEGESIEGKDAEIPIFAALTGKTVQQVHAAVAELKRRDLVQIRGVWRAVLPHAIANSLAKLALQNIPQPSIKAHLVDSASERLIKSFSRRLGYLNDSNESIRTVEGWFSSGALLGDLTSLSSFKQALLGNVAPVVPACVLSALKRAAPDKLSDRAKLARLVRSIAYDVEYFDDSIELLARMAEADAQAGEKGEAAACLVSMFYLYLSGTLAPPEQRLKRIESFLLSENPVRQKLGLDALDATLEAFHFSSSYTFDFGSRSRNFGWHPTTGKEVKHWYQTFMGLLENLREKTPALADSLKKTLAKNFRGLYSQAGMCDELGHLFRKIAAEGFWRDGWVAIRQTLSFDAKIIPPKVREKLEALEKELHPRALIENVRAIVLGNTTSALDLDDIDLDADDNPTAAYERQEAIAKALGRQVVVSDEDFTTLVPDLVRGQGRLWSFGRGLAQGTEKPLIAWQRLLDGLKATPPRERRFQLVCGFLYGLHEIDSVYLQILLDSYLESPIVGHSTRRGWIRR